MLLGIFGVAGLGLKVEDVTMRKICAGGMVLWDLTQLGFRASRYQLGFQALHEGLIWLIVGGLHKWRSPY